MGSIPLFHSPLRGPYTPVESISTNGFIAAGQNPVASTLDVGSNATFSGSTNSGVGSFVSNTFGISNTGLTSFTGVGAYPFAGSTGTSGIGAGLANQLTNVAGASTQLLAEGVEVGAGVAAIGLMKSAFGLNAQQQQQQADDTQPAPKKQYQFPTPSPFGPTDNY